MSRLVVLPALLLLVVAAAPARAQSPSAGTVFIGITGFASVEKAPTTRGLGVADNDRSGTVAGGALGIGVHLTPRVSARFEWGLTDTLKQSQSFGVNALSPGLGAFPRDGLPATAIVAPNVDRRVETMTGLALVGFHIPARRASIEIVGGLGFVNQDVKEQYDVRIARPLTQSLPFPQPSFRSSTYHAVAVAGADVAVALTDHASIVPSFRAFALNGGLTMRPGLGLRWTF